MYRFPIALAAAALLAGCDEAAGHKTSITAPPLQAPPAVPSPAPVTSMPSTTLAPPSPRAAPVAVDPLSLTVGLIDAARFEAAALAPTPPIKGGANAKPGKKPAFDTLAIRIEVLLARARFSPGVVDGKTGTNLKHALAAYQRAHDIDETGVMDAATWQALTAESTSSQPAARVYTIAVDDIAGPFADDVGEDIVKLAALPDGPRFTSPLEALAERFHMSQALLKALNPDTDLSVAGGRIVVIDDSPPDFTKGDVARVEVSNADASAFVYDKSDKLIAFYPATVGSTEKPSPSGSYKVVGVARHPTYTYDPAKLKWGPRAAGKLTVKPGPNNPVGSVWIDLNAPSYGVHGTPDPDQIGKTASHGCVRLTNWDAEALAAGVKPGVTVSFVGKRAARRSKSKAA